jgi:hypothetical protein
MARRPSTKALSHSIKLAQLGVAVPQVMAHRLTRMALAGPTLSARDRKEFTGMVAEKQLAFSQAWTIMMAESMRLQQQFMLSWMTGRTPSLAQGFGNVAAKAMAPIHRKAISNSKRLARTKLR